MRVTDADATQAEIAATGAELHPGFTPDGPQEIAAFGSTGVRYVFFQGPEGWPFEFVAPLGAGDGRTGHDHYGVRAPSVVAMTERLADMGAAVLATHQLDGNGAPVHVTFLRLGDSVFEVFDAQADPARAPTGGWIGFAP